MPSRRPSWPARAALRAPAVLSPLVLAAACADQLPVTPPATSGAPSAARVLAGGRAPVPARYVVQFAPNAAIALSDAAVAASGGRVVGAVPVARGLVVNNVTNTAALAAMPGVVRVEESPEVLLEPGRPADGSVPNRVRAAALGATTLPRATSAPNTTAAPSAAAWLQSGVQWDLRTMRVPEAWQLSTAMGAGARVCIIDTGIDATHQELAGQLVASTSFVPNDPSDTPDLSRGYSSPTLDSVGHGSHTSGTVAAKGVVTAGVAPRASLMMAKVFAASGGTPTDRVVNAIAWCTDHGADVVSMSLGSVEYKNTPAGVADIAFEQAGVDYATSRGVVVVASAGNDNFQFPNPLLTSLPALLHGVVSVGATGPFSKFPLPKSVPNWDPNDPTQAWRSPDSRAYYSQYGSAVTVFAPGGNLSANLAWPFRIVKGLVQGTDLDGIYSVCSSASGGGDGSSGARNVGGVPTYPQASSCQGARDAYLVLQGTSMAGPHVAGLAALVTAEIGGARTAARQARVVQCITRSTDNIGPADVFGGGRVNAQRAIQLVRQNGC